MCSASMMFEQKRHGSKYRNLLIIPCAIVLILCFTGNPLLRLEQGKAQEKTLFGTVNHKNVDISNSAKEEIIRICGKAVVGWIPTTEFDGPPIFQNEQRQYISLVFESQMFMHIFVLNDGSIIAYIHPWNNSSGNYMVKNPDVLQDVIDILIEH